MAVMSESTLARAKDALVGLLLPLALPLLVTNIEKPHFCRVGVICCSPRAAAQQIRTARKKGEQRSEAQGVQGASVGAVVTKRSWFLFWRETRLDLATVRASAKRRPPKRRRSEKRRAAYRFCRGKRRKGAISLKPLKVLTGVDKFSV